MSKTQQKLIEEVDGLKKPNRVLTDINSLTEMVKEDTHLNFNKININKK